MKHILIASLTSIVVVFFISLLLFLVSFAGGAYSGFLLALSAAFVATVVASISIILFAIPIHLVLSHYNYKNVTWYIISALICDSVFIYGFKPFGNDTQSDLFTQLLICSSIGSIGAVVFWFFAVHRKGITSC